MSSDDSVVISGIVRDSEGKVVPGAAVLRTDDRSGSGGAPVTTDNSGRFKLQTRAAPASRVVLSFSASGLSPGVVTVPIKARVDTYRISTTLVKLQTYPLVPNWNNDIPIAAGAAGATRAIVPPTETVGLTLRIAQIDPANAPGQLRAAGADEETALQSGGMYYIDIIDASGRPTKPVPGTAIQLPPSNPQQLPDAQPFQGWKLNGEGEWTSPIPIGQPSAGMKIGIDEFGFWNADRNFRTACVRGQLRVPGGACSGARVQATGPDGISSHDSSGDDGGFCVTGAQTFSTSLRVSGSSTQIQMPSSAGACSRPETCKDIGTIPISQATCDGDGGTGMPGDPCAGAEDCVPGAVCYNQFCVGAGSLRISLAWSVGSDFDIHVKTPLGSEINFDNKVADGGTLDLDQCNAGCSGGTHVENVVFNGTPPKGAYSIWVENYSGDAAGSFQIEVAGAKTEAFSGSLPANSGATSMHFSLTVP